MLNLLKSFFIGMFFLQVTEKPKQSLVRLPFCACRHQNLIDGEIRQKKSELVVTSKEQNTLFVCNRGDTYYSITAGSRQGSLAKPLPLLFLTPRPALSSHQHRTLVCLFWSGNLHCAHSPANPTTACQACFELLDVSNSSNCSFSDT